MKIKPLKTINRGGPYDKGDQDHLLTLIFPQYHLVKEQGLDIYRLGDIIFVAAMLTGYLELFSSSSNCVYLRIHPAFEPSFLERRSVRSFLRSLLARIAVVCHEMGDKDGPGLYGFESDIDCTLIKDTSVKFHVLMKNTTGVQRVIFMRLD